MNDEQEIWDALHRNLNSIFGRDSKTCAETTAEDLSLYEWWVTPHRQDGLDSVDPILGAAWEPPPKLDLLRL